MSMKSLPAVFGCLGTVLLLTACGYSTQTTSGSKYLDRYAQQARGAEAGSMEADIRASANVEPLLTFPARIGIARFDQGEISPIPPQEAEAWLALSRRLGPEWGEFVPLSPLVAALASQGPGDKCGQYSSCLTAAVHDIRLGAARQHVDAVVIYEAFSKSEVRSNPLAVTKLVLIGFFLAPSENIEAEGFAQAILVDVRNGYTYGSASAEADDGAFALATSSNAYDAEKSLRGEAKTAAVLELTKEVEQMARDLRLELAEKRSESAPVPGGELPG